MTQKKQKEGIESLLESPHIKSTPAEVYIKGVLSSLRQENFERAIEYYNRLLYVWSQTKRGEIKDDEQLLRLGLLSYLSQSLAKERLEEQTAAIEDGNQAVWKNPDLSESNFWSRTFLQGLEETEKENRARRQAMLLNLQQKLLGNVNNELLALQILDNQERILEALQQLQRNPATLVAKVEKNSAQIDQSTSQFDAIFEDDNQPLSTEPDKEQFIVRIGKLIGENCITFDDGQKIYDRIHGELIAGSPVKLDFDGVSAFGAPFVNAAIGRLFKDIKPENLIRLVRVKNLMAIGKNLLILAMEDSQEYYSDEKIRKAVDEVLSEMSEEN